MILFAGGIWGLYIVAIGMLSSFVFMVTGAWLLLVGVQATPIDFDPKKLLQSHVAHPYPGPEMVEQRELARFRWGFEHDAVEPIGVRKLVRKGTAVSDDGASAFRLMGGPGLDWFIAGPGDRTDRAGPELVQTD